MDTEGLAVTRKLDTVTEGGQGKVEQQSGVTHHHIPLDRSLQIGMAHPAPVDLV